ncbi:ras-related protein Rab-6-like [Dermatophagoides farinae]|uniref:ras-related protein Rab-6-like n=1 Tax=Dermatophagoides farinae TaxID=6954 RepID=UPI003F612674
MKHKLVFLGEQGTGKTSIMTKFIYDSFDEDYQATIGIDFLAKTFRTNGEIIKLQLWDTAGQERFYSLIPSYLRDCSVAVIIYDITNKESFTKVDHWIDCIYNERGKEIVIAICGNKLDREDQRKVSYDEGKEYAQKFNAIFFETSAKTGENIITLFNEICKKLPKDNNDNKLLSPVEIESPSENYGKKHFCR